LATSLHGGYGGEEWGMAVGRRVEPDHEFLELPVDVPKALEVFSRGGGLHPVLLAADREY